MNNIVKNPTRKALKALINKQFTDHSQLTHRLLHSPNLQDFLFGWFTMGRRAQSERLAEMAQLLQGSRRTWLKEACATAYISGYVGRTWEQALAVMTAEQEKTAPPGPVAKL